MGRRKPEQKAKRTILIAGLGSVFLRGIENIFASVDTLRTIYCQNVMELFEYIHAHPRATLFVSYRMPVCLRDLVRHAAQNRCPLVVVPEPGTIPETLIAQGVQGVLFCDAEISDVYACLHAVQSGGTWRHERTAYKVEADEESLRVLARLKERDLQIVGMLYDQLQNKEIAEHFGVAEITVKGWVKAIYDKVGVSTRSELCVFVSTHSPFLMAIKPSTSTLPGPRPNERKTEEKRVVM